MFGWMPLPFSTRLGVYEEEPAQSAIPAFDETDDFAHGGEYGAYLHSAQNADYFIAEL